MNLKNFLIKAAIAIIPLGMFGCQKMSKPALPSDYPKDNVTLPAGNLRFFTSFDSTSTADKQLNVRFSDSISGYPSFFPDPSTTYTAGVTGTAYQGSTGTYLHYLTANDFGSATSFTIAFWLNVTQAQKDHNNAEAILSVSSTTNFWGNATIFADHEASTSDSMQLKFHFANGTGDNWDFQYAGATTRIPHMYDGNWHQIVFTYDASTKTGTLYVDGAQFSQKTNETILFDGKASQLVVGGFQEAVNIVDTYANNSWMSGFAGALDQIRLYNVALAASDVQSLYNNKQ